ncbi:hypothetical protein LSAT2_020734, partial [Lamellibrachia satsuma]
METCYGGVVLCLLLLFLNLSHGGTSGRTPDQSTLMQMCYWRKSSGNGHTLVSNSIAARHRSNICVCFATKTSYEDVSVTVKDFHCDTNSCPWKLSFYEDRCLTQQICCGKTETDF